MQNKLLFLIILPITVFAEIIIREDFNASYEVPEHWDANSIEIMGPGDYHHMAQISALDDYLMTPPLNHPAMLEFSIYATSAAPDLIIETSSDGEDFQAHPQSPLCVTPETLTRVQIELDPQVAFIKFSKLHAGTIYLDDIVISDNSPYTVPCPIPTLPLKQNSTHNLIYAFEVHNPATESLTLHQISFTVQGAYDINELAPLSFHIYQSNDLMISPDDTPLSSRGRCLPNTTISFSIETAIAAKKSTYFLISIDLSEFPYSQETVHKIQLVPIHSIPLFQPLTPGINFEIAQCRTIYDDFTDWDLADWIHHESFAIERPIKEGDGSSDYDNFATLDTVNNSSHCACVKTSTIAYGSWEFWIGEGNEWDTSRGNNYGVVLISDTTETSNLVVPSEDFHGYFIKNENFFRFGRQDGETSTTLFTFNLPNETSLGDSTNKQGGYSFRITRNLKGVWKFYLDCGHVTATTLRTTLTDNKYQDSVAFAVRAQINNPALKRKLYFDDLTIKSYSQPTIDLANQINCFVESVDDQKFIRWISTYDERTNFQLFYQTPTEEWVLFQGETLYNNGIYSATITDFESEKWKIRCQREGCSPQEIPITNSSNQLLYSYTLHPGWNLVGPSGCQNFEQSLPKDSIRWTWDCNLYCLGSPCGLTQGMWVKTDFELENSFVDSPRSTQPQLNIGWNLISFSTDFTYDFTHLLLFYFQDGYYHLLDGPVKPFQGYWVFRADDSIPEEE
jgi:hypothetical protein